MPTRVGISRKRVGGDLQRGAGRLAVKARKQPGEKLARIRALCRSQAVETIVIAEGVVETAAGKLSLG